MLCEINQTEKDKYCIISLICGRLKKNKKTKLSLKGLGNGGMGERLFKGPNLQ